MSYLDKLRDDESLFLESIALDLDFIPPIIKYRENEQKYIAQCINPLLHGRNGKNLLISGAPGIGKTAAVSHLLREVEEEGDVEAVYVNCWKKNSCHKILLEICKKIGYKWVHNKSSDELMKEISKILNKKSFVLCLDEIDKLENMSVLYPILEDIYRKTLLLICNDKNWLAGLDDRIRSRLLVENLEFRDYNYSEILGILKQRVEYAFVKDVFDLAAFEKIAEKTFEYGDIRVGLHLLKEAGEIAENTSSRKILIEHVEKAFSKLSNFKLRGANEIPDEDKKLVETIKKNSGRLSSEVYSEYQKISDKSYRTFQRRLKSLEEGGIISLKKDNQEFLVVYGREKKLDTP